ncbi:hypothetical protein BGZ76_010690 [Entomortierella beljakovae]|nr:hypothetical protein BGZ76_010690 [Entomortierella beljakovae]
MKPKCIPLVLSLSIATVLAAPIKSNLKIEDLGHLDISSPKVPISSSVFQALSAPTPSSFLIEFDRPATGVTRHERIRLEQVGKYQGIAATRAASVADQHRNFQSILSNDLNIDFNVRQEFFTLMNGISINLQGVSPSKLPVLLEQIRGLPGVVKVSPLIALSQPKAVLHDIGFDALAVAPQLSTAHEQTGVLAARDKLQLAGQGIKIGIIDTGVDYTHEAFGSCYGPGCKIEFGFDFVDPFRTEAPGGFDCVGLIEIFCKLKHGTHVAGIIAGNSTKNNFFGVAPQGSELKFVFVPTLGAYRVFPCQGSSKDDIIIAALEKAYDDGMDVVNLSLGGGSSWENTPLSKVAGRLVELGVVVVAAIGNDGEQGLSEVSSPSVNPRAISVASFEGSGYLANYFEIEGNPEARIDYSDSETKVDIGESPVTLVAAEHDVEGCSPYPSSINGSIAFIRRGSCTFVAKAKFAQDAGAIGCIFYNNVEGGLHPKADDPTIHIFGQGISMAQSQMILDQLQATNSSSIKIIYRKKKGVFTNEMANQLSTFSSWGLGPELELKPDIGAPGGYIYSTIPVEKGSFATMSGTSMATPYVAGSAALLLEAQPTIERSEVLGRLQLYSKPGLYKNSPVPNTVARQGAGMINIWDSIQGKLLAQPTHLALNDTVHMKENYTITITNHYDSAETFKISNWPAMSILGYTPSSQPTGNITYSEASSVVSFADGESVQMEAGETRSIVVSFKPPVDLDPESHWIYSGYIKIEPTSTESSRPALQIPYAGMLGSYGTVDILDLQEGYPMILGPTLDGHLVPILNRVGQAPQTFSMSSNKIVTLVLKVSNPLHNLQVYVLDSERKEILGMVPVDGEYIGRTDSIRSKFFVVRWAGRIIDLEGEIERLPDGDYHLVVVAPKPFSESDDLTDSNHESWLSPTIRIKHWRK